MEAVECGAAALAIVMGYYKKRVPLEELRVSCDISRDGSKASNIVKAARKYGFEAKGYHKELDDLAGLELPFIVFWNFNHFVVVEGFKKGKVFLNDPAVGPRFVTEEEFDHSFTGVVLSIKPGKDFQPSGEEYSIVSAFKSRLKGNIVPLVFLMLVGLALVIPGLMVPVFTKIFVDNYLIANMKSWVKPLLIGMGITIILRGGLSWLKKDCLSKFEAQLSLTSSSKFLWHVLRLPIEFYTQRSIGDISNRILLNDKVSMVISRRLAGIVLSAVMAVFYLTLMFYYDAVLTWIGIVIAVGNLAVFRVIAKIRRDKSYLLGSERGKLFGASINGLMLIETLKTTGRTNEFFSKLAGLQTNVINVLQEIRGKTLFFEAIPALLNSFNLGVILWIGGLRVMNGYMTVGMLVAFQSLMISFIRPINELIHVAYFVQGLYGDMMKLDDVLSHEVISEEFTSTKQEELQVDTRKLTGEVKFQNITFGYSRFAQPLIKDFNLFVKPGERVAIIGASGAGKSTIAKLTVNLFQPWEGEIYFSDEMLSHIPKDVLVNSVSMVDQDIIMFSGTIRDNITMWNKIIPEEDVIQAAKDACIHSDITARESGYDTLIEEGGGNFSGGQRQRLEIARALVTNPAILVCDEATSALDPITEMKIDDNVRRRGCTTIIVAHRLSTIRDCDEIIVLDKGNVVQRGTHEELKKQKGMYIDLLRIHSK